LENLYSYERSSPLTRLEHLQLFQINIWIQNKVLEGRLPDEFSRCIPTDIQLAAESRFTEYDKPAFERVQKDVA